MIKLGKLTHNKTLHLSALLKRTGLCHQVVDPGSVCQDVFCWHFLFGHTLFQQCVCSAMSLQCNEHAFWVMNNNDVGHLSMMTIASFALAISKQSQCCDHQFVQILLQIQKAKCIQINHSIFARSSAHMLKSDFGMPLGRQIQPKLLLVAFHD